VMMDSSLLLQGKINILQEKINIGSIVRRATSGNWPFFQFQLLLAIALASRLPGCSGVDRRLLVESFCLARRVRCRGECSDEQSK
jgi:hypothetical protein